MFLPDLKKEMLEIASGISLAYVERKPTPVLADAPTLLFVPGFTFSAEVFHHQLEEFSKTHHVIALDLRSHGASTITGEGNDYTTIAHDLELFIGAKRLTNIALIGWSFGALATWQYAAKYPRNLHAHICIDMPPIGMSEDPDIWTEGKIGDLGGAYHALTSKEGHAAMIREYAEHVMFSGTLSDKELSRVLEISQQTPYVVASQLFASGLFSNKEEEAKAINGVVPTRFYLAEHWSAKAEAYLMRTLPDASISSFGGHMMFQEFSDHFNRDLGAYLQSL